MMPYQNNRLLKSSSAARLAGMVLALCAIVQSGSVHAHGAVVNPIARQYKCYKDGNYGNPSAIKDPACRQLRDTSGEKPFVQWHEVSHNVSDYNDMSAVKAAIPDGTLCAANDSGKRGLDGVAPWFRTDVEPTNGKMTVTWETTQHHNPNFFQYYLSKPSYDGSRALRWDDLELMQHFPNTEPTIVGSKKFYVHEVPVPAGRNGYAVLYARWQRNDQGNEGFYNCSDINIIGSGGPPPFPWHPDEIYLKDGFTPKAGEKVRFRVMSHERSGRELVDVTLPITAQNQSQYMWPKQLAEQLNSSSVVRIGKRSGDQIVYDNSTLSNNLIYLKNQGDSTAMSIIPADENPSPPVARITGPSSVEVGKALPLSGSSSTGSDLRYAWTAPLFTPPSATGPSPSFTAPSSAGSHTISLVVSDAQNRTDSTTHSVTVTPPGGGGGDECDYRDQNADREDAWEAKAYSAGARVGYRHAIWQASYSTGILPPDQNDAWKLLSQIPVAWSATRAYEGGNQVHYQSQVYRAGWWIKGTAPPASPWTRIGPCASK
jgi:chitin-binding protein